jgi:hypothetical protein
MSALGCRRILDKSRILDTGRFWTRPEFSTREIPVFGAVLLLFPVFDVPLDFGRLEAGAANR